MRFQITSGILRVSDPGYADIKKSDYSHVYALFHTCRAKKGTWNVRCPSNKGYTKYLLACHKDVVNLAALNWTPLGKAPVDSGQMGVYDAHEYPQTYRDHERFYDTLLDEDRRVHVVGDHEHGDRPVQLIQQFVDFGADARINAGKGLI